MRSATRRRPVRHVVITAKTTAPTTRGNHPPTGILNRLAVRKPTSTVRKPAHTAAATPVRHRKRLRRATYSRTVVMTMVAVTAVPYAAARPVDDRKPMTSATQATVRDQFTAGT